MRDRTTIPEPRSSTIDTLGCCLVAVLLIISFSNVAYLQTPTTAEGYVEAGVRLVQVGYLDNAVAFFSKAIELKPELADAYNNRGFVYHKQKKSQLALADFAKAIQLQPKNALYYKNRAFAYSTVNFDLAISDYKTALTLDPTDAVTWYRLGAHQAQRRTDSDQLKAVDHFSEAIRLRPDFVDAYIGRGEAYNRAEEKDDLAMADFNKAIELVPGYAEAYASRGNLLRKQFKYELAIADMTKAIQLMPRNANYYHQRGYMYLRQQGAEDIAYLSWNRKIDRSVIELAIADFTKAIQLQPVSPISHKYRATAYCFLGEKALSGADYLKAKEQGVEYINKCP